MFRALIADDELHMRYLIGETLKTIEDEDIEILTVSDGESAISYFKKYEPQIAFIDVMMPEIDGYQVCSYVKNDPVLKPVFLVLLTAKGQDIDKLKGKEAGADIYITKPFDPDYIIEITKKIIYKNKNAK
jgi:CheY-like chemotaxis protein